MDYAYFVFQYLMRNSISKGAEDFKYIKQICEVGWNDSYSCCRQTFYFFGSQLHNCYFEFVKKKSLIFSQDFVDHANYFHFFIFAKTVDYFNYLTIDLLKKEIIKISNFHIFFKDNYLLFSSLKLFCVKHAELIKNKPYANVFAFLNFFPFNLDDLVGYFLNLRKCNFLAMSLQDFYYSPKQFSIFCECIELLSGSKGLSFSQLCYKIQSLQKPNFSSVCDVLDRLKADSDFSLYKNEIGNLATSFKSLTVESCPNYSDSLKV